MRSVAMAFVVAVITAPVWACWCENPHTAFTALATGQTVVVATVVADSGPAPGAGPARVRVESTIEGDLAPATEMDVDVMARTDCYRRLRAGVRYVLFVTRVQGDAGRVLMPPCSNSFLLAGREHVLAALRAQLSGTAQQLVGNVSGPDGGVAGALVVARAGMRRYEAVTDEQGRYAMHGVEPVVYRVEVSKEGFVVDPSRPHPAGLDGVCGTRVSTGEGAVVVRPGLGAAFDAGLRRSDMPVAAIGN